MECTGCRLRRLLTNVILLVVVINSLFSCESESENTELSPNQIVDLLSDSLRMNEAIVKFRSLESDNNLKNHMISLFIDDLDSINDQSPQREAIEKLLSKDLINSNEFVNMTSSPNAKDTIEINISDKVYNEKGNYACIYFAQFDNDLSKGYIVFFKKEENNQWSLYYYRRLFR